MDSIHRYRGCLLGLAIGDAVGTTLEFRSPGTFTPIDDMVGGGPFGLRPGQWTDDTSMALCLAESLIEREGFDPVDQMQRYVRWWRHGYRSSTGTCFDIGNTTRTALLRFEESGEPYCGLSGKHTAGNGSLMRLAPVSLFFAHDPHEAIQRAGDSSRTTHGATAAIDACRYMAALIVGALRGEDKQTLTEAHYCPIPDYWEQHPLTPVVAEVAAGSFRDRNPPEIEGTGYVVRALEAALWAFGHSDSFRDGCLLAVNLGDDADTTGAIYGQLAGAYYGEAGIPQEWRAKVSDCDLIVKLAEGLHNSQVTHAMEKDSCSISHVVCAVTKRRSNMNDDDDCGADVVGEQSELRAQDWITALAVLKRQLSLHGGCVSSKALRKELERKGIPDARDVVVRMKLYDFDGEPDPECEKPEFRYYHHGRSFFSEEQFREKEAATDAAAESASTAEPKHVTVKDQSDYAVRKNRQEEARLVTYVVSALEEWYGSDSGPDAPIAFDVHNQRAGNDFENVDALAVHWRSDEVVDLVTVEVKLQFHSRLVQQANNYRRFSNRVWIAVPVGSQIQDAAYELRELDSMLFEYVVELGIGILACRRRQGGAYAVAPIHWPRLCHPDPVERDAFVGRYHAVFEDAGVVAPETHTQYPRLR